MISVKKNRSFCQFCCHISSNFQVDRFKQEKGRKLHRIGAKVISLTLNIAAVIIALPFLIIIFMLGKIVPQEQWSEFWDDYRDLP